MTSESVDKHKQPSLPYQSRLAGIVPRFTGGGGLFLRLRSETKNRKRNGLDGVYFASAYDGEFFGRTRAESQWHDCQNDCGECCLQDVDQGAGEVKYSRAWHTMRQGDVRIIRTLSVFQIHCQVSMVRKRHRECADWRWSAKTFIDHVRVERVR